MSDRAESRARGSRRKPRPVTDRDLVTLLLDSPGATGEPASETARELRRRLDREPELSARFERMRATWEGLELAPARLPPGFAGRILGRLKDDLRVRRDRLALTQAPLWVRTAAALALTAGVVAGVVTGPLLVGRRDVPEPGSVPVQIAEEVDAEWLGGGPGLAESYVSLLEGDSDGGGDSR